jgi:ComF family protein
MRLILPYTCVLCHAKGDHNDLCRACAAELPLLQNTCLQCALPLEGNTDQHCGACQTHSPYYDHTIALFDYADPVKQMITQFKFHQQLLYATIFGKMLVEKIRSTFNDAFQPMCLMPVPLHPSRLRERGYNQALELARSISKPLRLPIDYRSLVRTRMTEQQSLTAEDKRQTNVHNAFALTKPMNGEHIVLVDDVMTTGHTINECSRLLKKNGVQKITVLTIARTRLI